jgi:hypothetical protein
MTEHRRVQPLATVTPFLVHSSKAPTSPPLLFPQIDSAHSQRDN